MSPRYEPIVIGWLGLLVGWLALRYGLKLSPETTTEIAGAVGTLVVIPLIRRYVTPTARPRAADGTPLLKAHLAGPPPTSYQPRAPRRPPDEGLPR